MKNIKNRSEAENLAVEALAFIASDHELLSRFLNITGISAQDIRHAAATPGFLAGVLSFLLNHEPTLLAFTQQSQNAPEAVQQAFSILPGGEQDQW